MSIRAPHSGHGNTGGKSMDGRAFLPALIIATGCAAYCNSFSGAFVLDDQFHIVENPRGIPIRRSG